MENEKSQGSAVSKSKKRGRRTKIIKVGKGNTSMEEKFKEPEKEESEK